MTLTLGSFGITPKFSNTVLSTNNASGNNVKVEMSGVVQNTSAQQWYLAHQASTTGTNIISNVFWYYTRIA